MTAVRDLWKRFIEPRNGSRLPARPDVLMKVAMDRFLIKELSSDVNGEVYDFVSPSISTDRAFSQLVDRLAATSPFQRLNDIRFLGGLDYLLVRSPNGSNRNRRYTRAQHSLGVASLAQHYLSTVEYSEYQRKVCVSAALLHDIGHSPFSHTLEPVLYKHFGLNHHKVSEDIILGRSYSTEIADVLRAFDVEPEDVAEVLSSKQDTFGGFFSGPINFDTIEGILRSRAYLKMERTGLSPLRVLEAAVQRKDARDLSTVDAFWSCKDEIYSLVIRSPNGVLFDALFQQVAEYCISEFDPSDFYLTETQSFRRHPALREVTNRRFWPVIVEKIMPQHLAFETRRFYVEEAVDFFRGNLTDRYRQSRQPNTLTLK